MQQVLCFGDSNTWGYDPANRGERYSPQLRWTGLLQMLLAQSSGHQWKVVEEGPPYAAFLFCAKNSASVLPTLRSRCVELKLPPEEAPGQGQAPQEEAVAPAAGRSWPPFWWGAMAAAGTPAPPRGRPPGQKT